MKTFFFFLFAIVLAACSSNEKLAQEKCEQLLKDIQKANTENWTEQQFFTEINGLKVDRDRLISIAENCESIDKEVIADLQQFMDEFNTISQQKKAFKKNIKARQKLFLRIKKLKYDMDNGLGKKELYFEKTQKEEKNWKLIQQEYNDFETSVNELHSKFGEIRLNLKSK